MEKLRSLRNKKGFTLVEMVVVIVIIAILAAALVTSLVGYINRARETSAQLEASNVYTAAQAYLSEEIGMARVDAPYTFGDAEGTAVDAALIAQVCEYLGDEDVVAADADRGTSGEITALTTDEHGSIATFNYTASNGETIEFDGTWEITTA